MSAAQGPPGIASHQQKPGGSHGVVSPSETPQGVENLILDSGAINCKTIHFCCSRPRLWRFVMTAPGCLMWPEMGEGGGGARKG